MSSDKTAKSLKKKAVDVPDPSFSEEDSSSPTSESPQTGKRKKQTDDCNGKPKCRKQNTCNDSSSASKAGRRRGMFHRSAEMMFKKTEEYSILCDQCGRYFKNKHNLGVHKRGSHGETVHCPGCKKHYKHLQSMLSSKHFDKCQKLCGNKDETKNFDAKVKGKKCWILNCSITVETWEQMKQHWKNEHTRHLPRWYKAWPICCDKPDDVVDSESYSEEEEDEQEVLRLTSQEMVHKKVSTAVKKSCTEDVFDVFSCVDILGTKKQLRGEHSKRLGTPHVKTILQPESANVVGETVSRNQTEKTLQTQIMNNASQYPTILQKDPTDDEDSNASLPPADNNEDENNSVDNSPVAIDPDYADVPPVTEHDVETRKNDQFLQTDLSIQGESNDLLPITNEEDDEGLYENSIATIEDY